MPDHRNAKVVPRLNFRSKFILQDKGLEKFQLKRVWVDRRIGSNMVGSKATSNKDTKGSHMKEGKIVVRLEES